jgi:hypothetical protein
VPEQHRERALRSTRRQRLEQALPIATATTELVDAAEIARRLGLSSGRVVTSWSLNHLDFPAPVARRRALLWRWVEIVAWRRRRRR